MSTTNNTSGTRRPDPRDNQGALGILQRLLNVLTLGRFGRRLATERDAYDTEPVTQPIDASRGYERTDLSARLLARLALGFIIFSLIGGPLYLGFYYLIAIRENTIKDASRTPLNAIPQQAPPPQLQLDPRTDMQRYFESEQKLLSEYSWVNQQNNIVRIPIEQAMRLTLERGLPVREGAPAQPSLNTGGDWDETHDLDSEGGVPAGVTVTP